MASDNLSALLSELRIAKQLLKSQLGNENLSSKLPKLSSEEVEDEDETDLNIVHNNKILESHIKALMNSRPILLPDDSSLLNLAEEQSQLTSLQTSHSLVHHMKINEKLKKERRSYELLCTDAEDVDVKLQEIIDHTTSEVDSINSAKHKYALSGVIFHELRKALKWYLNTHFLSDRSNDEGSMEDFLEMLTKQFLTDPNYAYIQYDPEIMKSEFISFLIKANMITRHPEDFSKIKLVDCRIEQ